MTRIIYDEELKNRLLGFQQSLEVCDAQGRVVARVTPTSPAEDSEGWVQLTKDLTEEEYLRASQSTERGISTAELLERLRVVS
jgi:hypothetical protein